MKGYLLSFTMVFYKYVSAERIDILQRRLIRFTQPYAMNDPFEGRPDFYELGKDGFVSAYAEMILRIPYFVWKKYKKRTRTDLDRWALAKEIKTNPDYAEELYQDSKNQDLLPILRERFYDLHNESGILSLSETRDNLLMWAHYAEGHTGFVLVLDGSHNFFKGNKSLLGFAKPERVEYRSERPSMKIEETSKEAALREIFFVKGLDWKYEKEWRYLKVLADTDKRLIRDVHDVNLFRLPPKCIMGVIFGCNSTKELQNEILELRHNDSELGHLQIQQVHVSQRHYRLDIGEIET